MTPFRLCLSYLSFIQTLLEMTSKVSETGSWYTILVKHPSLCGTELYDLNLALLCEVVFAHYGMLPEDPAIHLQSR